MNELKFSLVSTVFNEANRLNQTIKDLQQQTYQPTEIIITDAGSTDGTYRILLEWKEASDIPVIILQKQRCNIAEGRNMAIHTATYDLIVSTDFGCRFHPKWLESIITPFIDSSVNVVGGAFTVEESLQDTIAAKAGYLLSNGYRVDVNTPWFIPSSRSIAYRKYVFDKVGGYCEWLTLAADDFVFGKEVVAHKYKIVGIDKPYVFWGRYKKSNGFIKEAYRYGLGDGEARVNFRNFASNLIQMLLRVLFILCLFSLTIAIIIKIIHLSYFLILILFALGFRPYIGYAKNWLKLRSEKYDVKAFLYGIYLLEATRLNYIRGFLKGFFYSTSFQKEQAKMLRKRLNAA